MSQPLLTLELLGTKGCHLCEVAERMVRRLAPEAGVQIQYVDIADDAALVEQFGMSIPVLRVANGDAVSEDLGWPFSEDDFLGWAQAAHSHIQQ